MKELKPGQRWANDKQTAAYIGVTTVCIWNWEKDESLGFPAVVRIGRKKLRNLDEVDAWLRARTVRRVVRVTEQVAAL
jgi:predicted DNA-binding transcriptional regulator AlpA